MMFVRNAVTVIGILALFLLAMLVTRNVNIPWAYKLALIGVFSLGILGGIARLSNWARFR